jgi:hypothetical protein
MAATIISTTLNAGGKILRKSQRSSEVDGLVTLTETYTIRRQDIESIEPERNTSYATFTGSGAYPRMLVETTRVDPLDGGLASLSVTYVGLDYSSGLPPAYVTAVGQPGVGVFGADASVVVRYLTQTSVFDLLKGSNITLEFSNALVSSNLTLPSKRFIPATINGTAMPPNPRAREYRLFAIGSFLSEWLYAGYVQTSISFQRRGSFNQIEEQFTEYFVGSSDMFTRSGTINLDSVNRLNGSRFFF